jgi:carboxymethylenebutenolidase
VPAEEFSKYRSFDGFEVSYFKAAPEGGYGSAVIVIHEIFGITEYIKNVARRLAGLGYLAAAPNLYSREADLFTEQNIAGVMRRFWSLPPERRTDPKAVAELAASLPPQERRVVEELVLNREATEERMVKDVAALYEHLKEAYRPRRIGIIGFCMGGGIAFEALTRVPIDAGVIYYGRAPKRLEDVANIRGAVLAIYAGEDPAINRGVPDLVKALMSYKVRFEMAFYPGTHHAFATEGGPVYDKAAAEDAWERTANFFRKHL